MRYYKKEDLGLIKDVVKKLYKNGRCFMGRDTFDDIIKSHPKAPITKHWKRYFFRDKIAVQGKTKTDHYIMFNGLEKLEDIYEELKAEETEEMKKMKDKIDRNTNNIKDNYGVPISIKANKK